MDSSSKTSTFSSTYGTVLKFGSENIVLNVNLKAMTYHIRQSLTIWSILPFKVNEANFTGWQIETAKICKDGAGYLSHSIYLTKQKISLHLHSGSACWFARNDTMENPNMLQLLKVRKAVTHI